MTREIKFRVWNKTIYPDLLEYTIISFKNTGWINMTEETNGGIDEYTGLKDKNGKEIYEGDILEYQNEEAEGGRYAVPNLEYNNYDNLLGMFDSEWDNGDESYSNIEIIGNIYENKDLLK